MKKLTKKHGIDGRRAEGFERIERFPDGAVVAPAEIGAAAAGEFIEFVDSNLTLNDLGLYAQPQRCLHMLTMHSAKGREFDAVAIVDLHDGKVPDFRSKTDKQRIAESRRLLYVFDRASNGECLS